MPKLGKSRSKKESEPTGEGPVVIEVRRGWKYRAKIVGADENHTGVAEYTDRQGNPQRTHRFRIL